MSAPSLPRIAWIVVGALLLAAGPVRGQPDEAKKSVADKHVDHEGLPLPAEAIARVGSARFRAVGLSPDVAYTPDAKTIVSVVRRNASGRDLIQFWAAETGKVRHETSVKMAFFAPGLTFLGDGKMLYLDEQLTCHALDCCQNAKELWKRKLQVGKDVPPGRPTCVRFSPQGSHVAVRWRFERLALFELAQGRQIGSLNPKIVDNQLNINGQSVAFSPDGTALAVASPDNRIEIFDAADLKKRLVIEAPLKSVDDVAFSADGRHLLCTGHNECSVLIRDWANKQQVVRLDALIQYGVQAFSPDGHHLVGYTGPAHGLICFDLETGKEVRRIAFGSQCSMVAFSPDGQTLLAGNRNGAIGQWDFKSGNPLLASADPFDGLRVVRFSGDGKHLLAFTDRHVLMDWRSGGAPTACAAAETPDRRFATLSPDAT